MLCNLQRFVPQQLLSVSKVVCIRRGLGPSAPKLKRGSRSLPGFVKPIPQHQVGKGWPLSSWISQVPLIFAGRLVMRSMTWASSPVISMASFLPVLFCLRWSAPSRMS